MSSKRDYYDILGVGKNATPEEIKKAFRKLALEFHPDRNKDKDAEARFKEINEAYQVLSDPEKKQSYDQFGHDGVKANFQDFDFNNFGGFGDIFDAFFGGSQSSRSSSRRKGRDLHKEVLITFQESAFGVEKDIHVERIGECKTCSGSGAKDQSNIITCSSCKGSGQIKRVQKTIFGQFAQSGICSDCSGSGKTIKEKCSSCSGKGATLEKRDISVKIPRGVSSGDTIKLSGEGEFGGIGSVKGDIFIKVNGKSLMLDRDKKLMVVNSDEIDQKSKKYVRYETDIRLLKKLLMGPRFAHWNNAEIGSHLKFYRKPNIFERDIYNAMLYFHS